MVAILMAISIVMVVVMSVGSQSVMLNSMANTDSQGMTSTYAAEAGVAWAKDQINRELYEINAMEPPQPAPTWSPAANPTIVTIGSTTNWVWVIPPGSSPTWPASYPTLLQPAGTIPSSTMTGNPPGQYWYVASAAMTNVSGSTTWNSTTTPSGSNLHYITELIGAHGTNFPYAFAGAGGTAHFSGNNTINAYTINNTPPLYYDTTSAAAYLASVANYQTSLIQFSGGTTNGAVTTDATVSAFPSPAYQVYIGQGGSGPKDLKPSAGGTVGTPGGYGDFVSPNSGTVYFAPGEYDFDNFTNNATIVLSNPAQGGTTVFFAGTASLSGIENQQNTASASVATITGPPGAHKFILEGGTATLIPQSSGSSTAATASSVSLSSNTFNGVLNAPTADVNVAPHNLFYGALVGYSVHTTGQPNIGINYDYGLATGTMPNKGTVFDYHHN
jgi:hypothetical protein